jgi:hypothetical protein
MITEQAIMTTEEVAKRFHELSLAGKWNEIQDELFSTDAKSIEPNQAQGLSTVTGLKAIKEKGKKWEEMIEAVHSGYCNEPQVAGRYFVCAMGTEVTMKGQPKSKMDEIALYEVSNGKIVSEQFFY